MSGWVPLFSDFQVILPSHFQFDISTLEFSCVIFPENILTIYYCNILTVYSGGREIIT